MSVHVRRAEPRDAHTLARLRYAFRSDYGTAIEAEKDFVERCERWMKQHLDNASWHCWVAEIHDSLFGMIWLHFIEKIPNPVQESERHAYISSLYVRPDHRGAGAGSSLLEAALDECAEHGVDAVILWPTPRSRNLYERFGFSIRNDVMERCLSNG